MLKNRLRALENAAIFAEDQEVRAALGVLQTANASFIQIQNV
jgi:hypothetical protein